MELKNIHNMKLWNSPFNLIKNRTKTIEMRLNDDKRKLIKINDIIIFTNIETNETIEAEVINLYKYKNFEELYKNHDKISIGYALEEEANYTDMYQYYSSSEVDKYGTLAIEIKVIG